MALDRAFDYVDRLMETTMRGMGIPGATVAVTDRERVLHSSTHGVADLGTDAPVTPETLFEIGSLGKPFTVIPLLQLRDQGSLDLDAPVTDYLPWFEVQSAYPAIRVRHLLNHTSGLVRGTDVAPHGLYESWALRFLETSAPPGEFFTYSNIGYKTLGFILERMTGQSLREIIRARVLDPLGMTRSVPAITAERRSRIATGYTSLYDDRPEHATHPLVPALWAEYGTGDGAQASTAADMAAYMRMLLNRGRVPNGRLLSTESFDLMTTGGVWTGGDYYACGLATYSVDGCEYIGHGGGNAGFRSALVVDMAAGFGAVLLVNRMGETDPMVEVAQRILAAVRSASRGDTVPSAPRPKDPLAVSNASDYVGVFRSGDKTLHIRTEEDRLLLEHQGVVVALESRGGDRFYAHHPNLDLWLLMFGREEGQVVEVCHGPDWYVNDRYAGPTRFDTPPEWTPLVGHYRARNPELSNFRVVVRKGRLVLGIPWGEVEPLVPLADGRFRIGADTRSPETLRFDAIVDGRALRAEYSGCPYYRALTP